MTNRILVASATKHGSTHEVAAAIAARLRAEGLEIDLLPAGAVDDLQGYAGVVLGGSLYTGHWHEDAVALLRRHEKELAALPVAVFALGPLTLEAQDVAGSLGQLTKAVAKAAPDVDPYAVGIFGGVIDPKQLRFPFSRMRPSDARDWDAVDAFAVECARAYDFGKPAGKPRDLRTELQQTHR
jgi:menaquinone-dependent protoporphyrinogen oxidase